MASHSGKNSINQTALTTIDRRIDLYEQGKINLPQLAQDLFSTVRGMIDVPTDWHNNFMKYWSAVEEVNALALAKGSYEPIHEHRELLCKTLESIRELVRQGI